MSGIAAKTALNGGGVRPADGRAPAAGPVVPGFRHDLRTAGTVAVPPTAGRALRLSPGGTASSVSAIPFSRGVAALPPDRRRDRSARDGIAPREIREAGHAAHR